MTCPQCIGIEKVFTDEMAERELRDYHKKGPAKTTRLLVEAIRAAGVEGRTVLDIGGGVGAIQYALLKAGAAGATSVDASSGYTAIAAREAAAQGYGERITHRHGNFVDIAPELEPADIVTLDRVLCCYHDMPALVEASAGLGKRLYGVVFPVDRWLFRVGMALMRTVLHVIRHPMRFFIHPTDEVEARLDRLGYRRRYYRRGLVWQVILYERGGAG